MSDCVVGHGVSWVHEYVGVRFVRVMIMHGSGMYPKIPPGTGVYKFGVPFILKILDGLFHKLIFEDIVAGPHCKSALV